MSSASLDVSLLPSPQADAELSEFLDACPTSFAQQTQEWRDVVTSAGNDEALFLACRQGGALVGVLPAYLFATIHAT